MKVGNTNYYLGRNWYEGIGQTTAPAFITPPTITGVRGHTNVLTITTGTASNASYITTQVRADGVPIPGATNSTFVDGNAYNGKGLRVSSIAIGAGGIAYATSVVLPSSDYPNIVMKTNYTGTNGVKLNSLSSVGVNAVGTPVNYTFFDGGDNLDGTGANQQTNRDAFQFNSNYLQILGKVGTQARNNYAKALMNTGFQDHGIECTLITSGFGTGMTFRYLNANNFYDIGVNSTTGGRTYLSLGGMVNGVNNNNLYLNNFCID